MKKSESAFDTMRRKMVDYLFNPKVLSRSDVSPTIMSRITGNPPLRYYRYFEKLHMDVKNGYKTDLSKKQIAQKLGDIMSLNEFASLYEWARQRRFDKRVTDPKRPYHSKKSQKKKVEQAEKELQAKAKNAKLIQSMGIPQIVEAPNAGSANLYKKPQTTAEILESFIKNSDTTSKESMELIKALLGIGKTTNESTGTMFLLAMQDKKFSREQWALEHYLMRKSKMIRNDLIQGFINDSTNFGEDNKEQLILDTYRKNKDKFDLAKLKRIGDD